MHLQKENYRISHVILLFDIGLCNDEISSSTVIVLFHKKDALQNQTVEHPFINVVSMASVGRNSYFEVALEL